MPLAPELLPAGLARLIAADKSGPWCVECGWSMPQTSRDRGEYTHPACGPNDQPVKPGQTPMTARQRGAAAAKRGR